MASTSMKQLFKGIAQAQVSSRNENMKLGRAIYLLNKTSMEESRKGAMFIKRILTCLVPIHDGSGREPGSDNYTGELKGNYVSSCIFQSDYFHKEMKEFILKSMGYEPKDEPALIEAAIADLKAADPKFKPAANETEADAAWSAILEQVIEGGCLDGMTALEFETKEKVSNTGKFVKDSQGNLVEEIKTFANSYIKRRVPLAEIGTLLDAKDIERFFGSVEKFNELKETVG